MTTGLVGQNQIALFTSPIPGGSLDATVVLGNDNSTVTSYDAHDNDSTIHFQSSTLANRPPASTAGQKWLTTDAAARYLYYDSGSAWTEVNYFHDSGGIITGAVTISDTTESTSTTTGALIVSGGVGIAKNVFIGGTLGVTGVATFTAKPIVSTLTASLAVFSDSVKGLVSNALTGTGNVVMSASPTLTGTIGAASMTLSGTLGVTGVATLTAQPIISSLTASKPVFTDASKGLVSTGTLGTDQGGTNLTTYTAGDILYASATNVLSKLAIGTTGQHLIVTAGLPAWGTDTALGTVTSVGWTGGLVSVATATTTPAFTVAGTSGGVVYFSSASTWASSAALTQYGMVYGGGAGATPVATAAGTTGQVLTAVTSGAPVWSATYAGTVTSVGFTGGLISVATATTTPALTVAGTSGGVVYFSSASTWASSAALTASAIVLGGGAGAAPATTTTGTGVVTALGVNVGTAGAFVVNGGALGTPSSGAVAASLITAGTFGAGAYTFPGALAITGALTGATTGAFSGAVSMAALTATTGAFSGAVDMATIASVGTASVSTVGLYVRQINTLPSADVVNIASYISASSVNTSSVVGYYGTIRTQAAAFTCATGRVIDLASPSIGAGSALTTLVGVNIENMGAAGITNAIGIDVAAQSGASSLNIGIRNAGTLTQTGAATFSSTLAVTGTSTMAAINASGTATLSQSSNTECDIAFFRNTSNGTSASTWVNWGNDAGVASGAIAMYSSTNTTKPSYFDIFNRTAAGTLRLGTSNLARLTIDSAGAATFSSTLGVTGAATFSSTAGVTARGLNLTDGDTIQWTNSSNRVFFNAGIFRVDVNGSTYLSISTAGAVTATGVYSTTVGATNRDVYVDSTGLIGYVSSIRAAKTNITPLTDTAWLDALTPVAFNYRKKDEDGAWTDEANTPLEYGLIAEDVENVNTELVFYDETEDGLALRGVSYNKLMIPLLQRVQALTVRNDALTARVAALEGV